MSLRPRALALTAGVATLLLSGALLSPAVTATPAAAAAPAASRASASFTPAAPRWGACRTDSLKKAKAQCARITVPLDYSKPTGTKIKIAVSRIVHTTKRYQGVMIVNPGGPGGSGLGLALLKADVPDGGGDTYDWIGFDPRGVGDSEPAVSCDDRYFGDDRPRYVPATPALSDAWFTKADAYTKACAAKNGPILDHLTTEDSAHDLESIRKALGEKTISYYGFSYGTYLGQVYGTLFPSRLRRAVFDGTVDPRRVWYAANLDQDTAFDANVDRWFRWVAEYDRVYHLGKTEAAVSKRFYATEEQLYDHPVKARGGRLGGSEWVDAFLYAGYNQLTWEDLAKTFSDFVRKDDVGALEAAYLDADGDGDDNGYAVYLGVQCTDTTWPKAWSTWRHDTWDVFADAPFETWANAWYNEPCRSWPGRVHPEVRIDGSKVKSLLMVNETLDAATPYAGSLEVRQHFEHARLIAEPGGTTHAGSLSGNACVDDRIAAYLRSGTLPRRKSGNRADVTCAPLPQPDPTASDARATRAAQTEQVQKDLTTKGLVRGRAAVLAR